jgi:MFS transporter, DHA2 family, multidrug resistance protein
MSSSTNLAAGISTHDSARPFIERLRPYVGIAGVLIGSVLATLGSRVTTFGLADLRGQLHAGFDEGAWITTSFGIGQMLAGVACPYLAAVFGVRRLLLLGIVSFFTAGLLGPSSPNLPAFIAMQLVGGIGSGTFIPVAIMFIVRNLPPRLVLYGLAAYAMNSEFSQNVAASLEGWYADNWTWHWVDWQYCILLTSPDVRMCVVWGATRADQSAASAKP